MITFYVHKNQLYNFLELKEPVELVNYIMSNDYFEMQYDPEDLIIKYYRTRATVELNTFRKKIKRWLKRKN